MDMRNKSQILKLSIALTLFGTIFLCMTIFSRGITIEKVIFCIIAILLYIIAGVFIVLYYRGRKNINIFLYDEANRRRKSVDELNFSDVCKVLDKFIPIYVYKLCDDNWFQKNVATKIAKNNSTLTKLVYLRLLYIWIGDNTNYNGNFNGLTKEDVGYIIMYMESMGEHEISEKLKYINSAYGENSEQTKMFFEERKEHLEKLIMSTVINNMRKF